MKRLVWSGLGAVLAIVVGSGAWALIRGAYAPPRAGAAYLETPRDYGTLPDFELAERSGRTIRREDLEGRFWVADFIFTRCTGVCPILSARMASLSRSLPGKVGLVSFSVDPTYDTPRVLTHYAKGYDAPPDRWLFLTGAREELYRLIGEGFLLSVAERPAEAAGDGELITHSDRFVILDPQARIRGYYHGTEEDSVRRLAADLERMLRDEPVH